MTKQIDLFDDSVDTSIFIQGEEKSHPGRIYGKFDLSTIDTATGEHLDKLSELVGFDEQAVGRAFRLYPGDDTTIKFLDDDQNDKKYYSYYDKDTIEAVQTSGRDIIHYYAEQVGFCQSDDESIPTDVLRKALTFTYQGIPFVEAIKLAKGNYTKE